MNERFHDNTDWGTMKTEFCIGNGAKGAEKMIDRKFEFVATNPCNGKVYTEENAVVFCAKDKALIPALEAYASACFKMGCDQNHIESIDLLRQRVIAFQKDVESRVPDTDSECEIDRCIGGNV